MNYLKVSTTDGELLILKENISHFLWQPGETTTMLFTKFGNSFECSGPLEELEKNMYT